MQYKVLIVEDDADIVELLTLYLNSHDFQVFSAFNGVDALKIVQEQDISVALVDVMMPRMNGYEFIKAVRQHTSFPIILVSAKTMDEDEVLGLNLGADDYITKPFNPVEVMARVRSQLRRYAQLGGMEQKPTVLQIGGIRLDDEAKAVTLDGDPVALTPIEYSILRLLMSNPGKVFSSSRIYELVWKDSAFGAEGTVAVHIRHLREKLEINPGEPRYLKVVWGQGYKIEKGEGR